MVGVIAFALLQAAEFGLGLAMGRGAAAYGRDLLTQRGQIGFAAQLAFAVLPLLVRPRP